jgi:hypothetical protein
VQGGDGDGDSVMVDGLAALGVEWSVVRGLGGEVGTSGIDLGVRCRADLGGGVGGVGSLVSGLDQMSNRRKECLVDKHTF